MSIVMAVCFMACYSNPTSLLHQTLLPDAL